MALEPRDTKIANKSNSELLQAITTKAFFLLASGENSRLISRFLMTKKPTFWTYDNLIVADKVAIAYY